MKRCEFCQAPQGRHAVFCSTLREAEALQSPFGAPLTLFDDRAWRVGSYALFPLLDAEVVRGSPPGRGAVCEGVATTWRVLGSDGVDHVLGDVRWPDGQRDVQILRSLPDGAPRFDVIVRRVRMPLERVDAHSWLFFVKQARLNNQARPTLCKASQEQLRIGAGLPVMETLQREFGLLDWGPANQIAAHRPDLSNTPAAIMDEGALSHLAAFVLTRIAPTSRGYAGELLMLHS